MAELKPSPLWVHCGAFGKKSTSNVSRVKLCISNISVLDWSILIPCFLPGPQQIKLIRLLVVSCSNMFQHRYSSDRSPLSSTDSAHATCHAALGASWWLGHGYGGHSFASDPRRNWTYWKDLEGFNRLTLTSLTSSTSWTWFNLFNFA